MPLISDYVHSSEKAMIVNISLSFLCNSYFHIFTFLQGGLRAVVWTDTFQTFIVIAGLIAITVLGAKDLGGIDKVWNIADKGGRIFFIE